MPFFSKYCPTAISSIDSESKSIDWFKVRTDSNWVVASSVDMKYGIRANIYLLLLFARANRCVDEKHSYWWAVAKRMIPVAFTVVSISKGMHTLLASLCGNLCQLKDGGLFDLLVHSNNSLTNQSNANRNKYSDGMRASSSLLFISSSLCSSSSIGIYIGYANFERCNAQTVHERTTTPGM